jgi:hypothetical protein
MRYKKIITPKPYEAETRRTCDLCGVTLAKRSFDATAVTICAKIGNIYPEGDFRTTEEADACPGCWAKKIRPALEALGLQIRKFETEDGYPLAGALFDTGFE